MLLLTVFAAFKLYDLLPAGAAFALSVVLVAGAGVLAVLQNAMALAVLGDPRRLPRADLAVDRQRQPRRAVRVLRGAQRGDLRDRLVAAVARAEPARLRLHLRHRHAVGRAGVPRRRSSPRTEPFLLLFFAFYLLIPILYARRQPAEPTRPGRRLPGVRHAAGRVLAAGRPAAWQSRRQRACRWRSCALGLARAVRGAGVAGCIQRERYRRARRCRMRCSRSGFATLAVPLALSARATAACSRWKARRWPGWACASSGWLPQLVGPACCSLAGRRVRCCVRRGPLACPGTAPSRTRTFMGALLIALAGLRQRVGVSPRRTDAAVRAAYYLWGLAWWLRQSRVNEIESLRRTIARADLLLARLRRGHRLARGGSASSPSGAALASTDAGAIRRRVPLALRADGSRTRIPSRDYGGWAWLVFAVLGLRSLRCLRAGEDRLAAWAQFAVVAGVAAALSSARAVRGWSTRCELGAGLGRGGRSRCRGCWWRRWRSGAGSGWRRRWRERFDGMAHAAAGLFLLRSRWGGGLRCSWPGGSGPLPWCRCSIRWISRSSRSLALLCALAVRRSTAPEWLRALRIFADGRSPASRWSPSITLRAVHHWGGVAWDGGLVSHQPCADQPDRGVERARRDRLGASARAAASASVAGRCGADGRGAGRSWCWSIASTWATCSGIGSFIAYGLLCTVVGYFAPAPPRAQPSEATGMKRLTSADRIAARARRRAGARGLRAAMVDRVAGGGCGRVSRRTRCGCVSRDRHAVVARRGRRRCARQAGGRGCVRAGCTAGVAAALRFGAVVPRAHAARRGRWQPVAHRATRHDRPHPVDRSAGHERQRCACSACVPARSESLARWRGSAGLRFPRRRRRAGRLPRRNQRRPAGVAHLASAPAVPRSAAIGQSPCEERRAARHVGEVRAPGATRRRSLRVQRRACAHRRARERAHVGMGNGARTRSARPRQGGVRIRIAGAFPGRTGRCDRRRQCGRRMAAGESRRRRCAVDMARGPVGGLPRRGARWRDDVGARVDRWRARARSPLAARCANRARLRRRRR